MTVEIDPAQPELVLRAPATSESLPVVRHGLRALGELVGAAPERLDDAELAVSEACANVVEHAYRWRSGPLIVTLRARADELLAIVRDRGRARRLRRPALLRRPLLRRRRAHRGVGVSLIEGVTRANETRPAEDGGTEVVMSFAATPHGETLDIERIDAPRSLSRLLPRLAAVLAAQADMTIDRMDEALLVTQLIADRAPLALAGDRVQLSFDRLDGGFELHVGPLEHGGIERLMAETEMPAAGGVVERLVDRVESRFEDTSGSEQLTIRLTGSRS